MSTKYLLLCLACACLALIDAKTVFRRTDKISEDFKQLNLPAEEIDPNVAPPEPQKIETISPEEAGLATATTAEAAIDAGAAATDEIIDESVNEIADSAVAAVTAAAPAAASGSAASGAAAAVTTEAPVAATTPIKTEDNPISKYCKCTDSHCDCCRNFGLPLIPVRGPGCARISYLGKDEMSVSIKYGDITLASRRISAKRARPICVGLPGGYSKFCGRVYGLSRAKENFKACLAFELRADDEVEAALRVSCFKFGPEGLKVAEAEPLPVNVNKDEDDDDDDIFGFAAGGDEDDEDEDEDDYEDDADTDTEDSDDYAEDDDAEAPEDADYGGFSLGGLLDELDDDDDDAAKPVKPAVIPVATATPAAADQTRDAVPDLAQSKDETGAAATVVGDSAAAVVTTADETVATPAAEAAEATTTPDKTKKSKKAKKNKKKKAASATESDFAYELLNGILDFFN